MSLPHLITFAILAVVAVGSALLVVTLRNVFHCALFLALSFLAVAGIYVLLNAEFLFAAQILIYVGAITVLIIFGIMLTQGRTGRKQRADSGGAGSVLTALAIAVVLFAGILAPVIRRVWGAGPVPGPPMRGTTGILGKQLLTTYLLPFELASLLLLVAMVGAIVLAMLSDRPEPVATVAVPQGGESPADGNGSRGAGVAETLAETEERIR